MEVLYQRCCGLDVHKKAVTACLVTRGEKEKRIFGTTTDALLELADWLAASGCTHVAMESTGVYWKPIYNLLESTGMEVLVVNAQHIKAVPGRKTDVKDAEWIADLPRHGLLRGSFIPDRPQRELLELVRYRRSLIQERSREINRVQKVLEGANIKLGSVATNVLGVSGRAMLEALVRGEEDPSALAALARARLKKKEGELKRALRGMLGAHQRMLLATQLRHIDFHDQEIARLDVEIAERMRPFEGDLKRVGTLPGVGRRTSEEIVAVTRTDMSRFPSAHHLASWAKMCPGNEESAGKRRSGRTGRGNPLLRGALAEAAWAASYTKNTYLSAYYHRLASRRGRKRAVVALGHTILRIIYHILKDKTTYQDLRPDYFDRKNKEATVRRTLRRLEALGYSVEIYQVA
ncbi:MAG: IS110 family transposase [Firmicutes bacterium]|nr:IS110 family transposase [Bacillota bacterium]